MSHVNKLTLLLRDQEGGKTSRSPSETSRNHARQQQKKQYNLQKSKANDLDLNIDLTTNFDNIQHKSYLNTNDKQRKLELIARSNLQKQKREKANKYSLQRNSLIDPESLAKEGNGYSIDTQNTENLSTQMLPTKKNVLIKPRNRKINKDDYIKDTLEESPLINLTNKKITNDHDSKSNYSTNINLDRVNKKFTEQKIMYYLGQLDLDEYDELKEQESNVNLGFQYAKKGIQSQIDQLKYYLRERPGAKSQAISSMNTPKAKKRMNANKEKVVLDKIYAYIQQLEENKLEELKNSEGPTGNISLNHSIHPSLLTNLTSTIITPQKGSMRSKSHFSLSRPPNQGGLALIPRKEMRSGSKLSLINKNISGVYSGTSPPKTTLECLKSNKDKKQVHVYLDHGNRPKELKNLEGQELDFNIGESKGTSQGSTILLGKEAHAIHYEKKYINKHQKLKEAAILRAKNAYLQYQRERNKNIVNIMNNSSLDEGSETPPKRQRHLLPPPTNLGQKYTDIFARIRNVSTMRAFKGLSIKKELGSGSGSVTNSHTHTHSRAVSNLNKTPTKLRALNPSEFPTKYKDIPMTNPRIVMAHHNSSVEEEPKWISKSPERVVHLGELASHSRSVNSKSLIQRSTPGTRNITGSNIMTKEQSNLLMKKRTEKRIIQECIAEANDPITIEYFRKAREEIDRKPKSKCEKLIDNSQKMLNKLTILRNDIQYSLDSKRTAKRMEDEFLLSPGVLEVMGDPGDPGDPGGPGDSGDWGDRGPPQEPAHLQTVDEHRNRDRDINREIIINTHTSRHHPEHHTAPDTSMGKKPLSLGTHIFNYSPNTPGVLHGAFKNTDLVPFVEVERKGRKIKSIKGMENYSFNLRERGIVDNIWRHSGLQYRKMRAMLFN